MTKYQPFLTNTNNKDFIQEQEHRWHIILKPYETIIANPNEITREFIIRYLQTKIRRFLADFVGHFSLLPMLELRSYLRPYHVEPAIVNRLLSLMPVVEVATKQFGLFTRLTSALRTLDKLNSSNEYVIAQVYSSFYQDFQEAGQLLPSKKKVVAPRSSLLDFNSYFPSDKKYIRPLFDISKESEKLDDYLLGFYLHGSLSTQDYIRGWSDVDTLAIIKVHTLFSPEKLVQLRRQLLKIYGHFFRIDPLQLHGIFIFTELDISCFAESYFPLELFRFTKSIMPAPKTIEFALREDTDESLAIFWTEVKFLLSQPETINGNKSPSWRKMYLHKVFSFPLFFLQALGQHTYKKFSFDLAKPNFPNQDWQAIDLATELMHSWDHQFPFSNKLTLLNHVNPKLFIRVSKSAAERDYANNNHIFIWFDKHYRSFYNAMQNMAIQGWQQVIESRKVV